MKTSEAITKRKSVRAYTEKPVDSDTVEKIIEAGRWAPNVGNFHISVIRNASLRHKINDLTHDFMANSGVAFLQQRISLPGYKPLYGAPVLVLLSAPENDPYNVVNTALSAENMLLEATSLGLGSCYLMTPVLTLNTASNLSTAREAGVPEGYLIQCALIVGYAAPENKFSPPERTRKGSVSYID